MSKNLLIVCARCLFFVIFIGASTCSAWAAEIHLTPAEEILDRYVEAAGGREVYDRINNRVTKATLHLVAQNMKLPMVLTAAKPNLTRILLESEVIGNIEKGTYGELVWESSVAVGPTIKGGAERDYLLRESTFDKFVYWREVYSKVDTKGETLVNEEPCFEVEVSSDIGGSTTLSFSKESGLLIRAQTRVITTMGEIPIVVTFSDYRSVDGALLPFKAETESLGQTRVLVIESISQNVELGDDFFKPSQDVLDLVSASDEPVN